MLKLNIVIYLHSKKDNIGELTLGPAERHISNYKQFSNSLIMKMNL